MDTLQWDDLRIFIALGREGSLSAAARRLGVEHTTVSRRASQLEKALGLKLFDRLPRGWTLTTEGQAVFDRACLVEENIQGLERAALGQSALAGPVRISMPPLLQSYFVLPHLGKLHAAHPELEFELIGERRTANLVRREADIAIRMNKPQEPDLVFRQLGDIGYGLFGTREQIDKPSSSQTFIGFDDSIPDSFYTHWLDRFVGTRQYGLRTNDVLSMSQAAANGWGIAFLPKFLAKRDQRLEPYDTSNASLSLPCYLVMHHDVRRSPRIRTTADFLIALFRTRADELV